MLVARIRSGETEVVISAAPEIAEQLRRVALPLAHGLSVVVELRTVLMERQAALDDAAFQLRALRQVARLLSSVHSSQETEQLILDFMAEVFFTWWACLLRPTGDAYEPRIFRSLDDRIRPGPLPSAVLDAVLPPGSGATGGQDLAVATLAPPTTEVVVPLDAGTERLAVLLLGPRINSRPYGPSELDLAGTLSFAAAIALKNAHLVEQLQTAANTDDLTGILNRRALEERLGAELSRSTRHSLDTTVLLLDIDRFKLVNDSGGHAAGDDLLRGAARLLKEQCRQPDIVGRLGGDEFLVILPMTTPQEAMVLVGRVQAGLPALSPTRPGSAGHREHRRGGGTRPWHDRQQPHGGRRRGDVQGQAGRRQSRRGRRPLLVQREAAMPDPEFILMGDAVWVDFVNTARGRGPAAVDTLPDPAAYHRWTKAEKLHSDAVEAPWEEVRGFRDRLGAVAAALADERQPPSSAIQEINQVLARSVGPPATDPGRRRLAAHLRGRARPRRPRGDRPQRRVHPGRPARTRAALPGGGLFPLLHRPFARAVPDLVQRRTRRPSRPRRTAPPHPMTFEAPPS